MGLGGQKKWWMGLNGQKNKEHKVAAMEHQIGTLHLVLKELTCAFIVSPA